MEQLDQAFELGMEQVTLPALFSVILWPGSSCTFFQRCSGERAPWEDRREPSGQSRLVECQGMRATRIKQRPPSSLQETPALKVFVAICCSDLHCSRSNRVLTAKTPDRNGISSGTSGGGGCF